MEEQFLSSPIQNISDITIQGFNETTIEENIEKSETYKLAIGIICAIISSTCLGSFFVPIRKYYSKDGQIIQFFISISLAFFGSLVQVIQGFPHINYADFIGGFFLSIALVFMIPIVNNIGSCLTFIIWNSVVIISLWCFSFFNLYGELSTSTDMPVAQYLGIVFFIIPIIIAIFVKTSPNDFHYHNENDIPSGVENFTMETSTSFSYDLKEFDEFKNIHSLKSSKRIIALGAAISTGVCLSIALYPYDFDKTSLSKMPNTIFSHALGTFLTSFIFFIIYSIHQRGTLIIDTRLILPSFLSGFLLIVFGTNFIISFYHLSNYTNKYQIFFQIFAFIPLLTNTLWSICYFREIPSRTSLIRVVSTLIINILAIIIFTISFI